MRIFLLVILLMLWSRVTWIFGGPGYAEIEYQALNILARRRKPMTASELIRGSTLPINLMPHYALRRMEKRGLLFGKQDESTRSSHPHGLAKYYYDLTDRGRERLAELRAAKNT